MTADLAKESIVFLGTVLLCALLVPAVLPLLRRCGLVDRPNARSSHTTAIPRGAGAVIVLSFVAVLAAYAAGTGWRVLNSDRALQGFLCAVAFLFGMGFIDDLRSVPSWVKLLFQVGVAYLLVTVGFVFPLERVVPATPVWLAEMLTLLWIVGVINAVNFIDGSDGLATSLSALALASFVVISRIVPVNVATGNPEAIATVRELVRDINVVALAGLGSALPFLLYNMSPAKCFLGDSGSTFLGLVLATIGILIARFEPGAGGAVAAGGIPTAYLIVPWLVLLIPIADAIRVAVTRMLVGRSPFRPDNRHIHHLLHRAGLSPNQIAFLVGLAQVIFSLAAALLVRSSYSPFLIAGIFILLVYGFIWFVKSSYRARRFVALALNRRLLHYMDGKEGYENAAGFRDRFEQEIARARRHNDSLVAVVVNTMALKLSGKLPNPLENPKFLDTVLRALRREDIKCRFSNDRLAFLLVETDRELAKRVCTRIRGYFDAIRNGESAELEVGIGMAAFPEDGAAITTLLQAAESRALQDISKTRVGEAVRPREAAAQGDPALDRGPGAAGSADDGALSPVGLVSAVGLASGDGVPVNGVPVNGRAAPCGVLTAAAGGPILDRRQKPSVPGAAPEGASRRERWALVGRPPRPRQPSV